MRLTASARGGGAGVAVPCGDSVALAPATSSGATGPEPERRGHRTPPLAAVASFLEAERSPPCREGDVATPAAASLLLPEACELHEYLRRGASRGSANSSRPAVEPLRLTASAASSSANLDTCYIHIYI
jgi:hypothetical protein